MHGESYFISNAKGWLPALILFVGIICVVGWLSILAVKWAIKKLK